MSLTCGKVIAVPKEEEVGMGQKNLRRYNG